LNNLLEKYSQLAIVGALELLVKLLKNISANPSDPKYRKIKMTNQTLSSRVFALKGIEQLLTNLGFLLDGEFYAFQGSDVTNITNSVVVFEAK